jgi:CIC family chloride channel protein
MPSFFLQILARVQSFLPKDKTFLVFILAGLVGLGGGLAVLLFRSAFVGIQHLYNGHVSGMVEIAKELPWWARLFLPALGGAVAGALLEYGLHLVSRRGADDYLEAITIGDGRVSVRQTLIKSLSSLCSIASGASIGREGPMVQLAAMVGSILGRVLKLPTKTLQLLVACGATAGLASAYNAPIAGLLFVAEIAFGTLSRKTLAPLIIASVMASVVTHRFFGIHTVYQIPHFSMVSDWETLFYVGLGIVCGFVSPVFRWTLDVSRKAFRQHGHHRAITMALGGLGVGAISVWNPNVWGNGYSVVNAILHEPWTWKALLTILVLKIAATALSYGSGAVGGVFTPSLFVGAVLGALYGQILQGAALAPDTAMVSYAIVGMGAFLSSVTYAPLMSILMIFELTLSYEIVLPLMLACVISHAIAHRFRPDSIYRK